MCNPNEILCLCALGKVSALNNKPETPAVLLAGVHKWFGAFHALKNINLDVRSGERIVICGPSGSGKSTMIRCINRLEEHQKGRIVVDGIELAGNLKKIDEIRREIGMVFSISTFSRI